MAHCGPAGGTTLASGEHKKAVRTYNAQFARAPLTMRLHPISEALGTISMRECSLQRVALPKLPKPFSASVAPSPSCLRVVCGNGGSGGHTLVLYS